MSQLIATMIVALLHLSSSIEVIEYSEVSYRKPPLVVLFYNSSGTTAYVSALKELELAEESNPDFTFYKCDVSQDDGARKAGLTEATHLFSWTVDRGVEETHIPLRKLYISRYLSFLKLIPVPESVLDIASQASMRPLLESSDDTPVFTMFHEPLCPHCYKAKRAFEQAAGFFQNFLTFVKIDCTLNIDTQSMCAAANVSAVPTFVLYTKPLVSRYEGGRSVAEFEMFFQSQKTRRKETAASHDALDAFNKALVTSDSFRESARSDATRDVAGKDDSSMDQCPRSCLSKLDELQRQIQDLQARFDALQVKQ